jgi:hypothetical protein
LTDQSNKPVYIIAEREVNSIEPSQPGYAKPQYDSST